MKYYFVGGLLDGEVRENVKSPIYMVPHRHNGRTLWQGYNKWKVEDTRDNLKSLLRSIKGNLEREAQPKSYRWGSTVQMEEKVKEVSKKLSFFNKLKKDGFVEYFQLYRDEVKECV